MDQSSIAQNRSSRRSKVLLAASIDLGGRTIPVKLRDLCPGGALIEGDALPIEGSRIQFRREHLSVSCRVAWSHGRRAGLAFDALIRPEDVLHAIRPTPTTTNKSSTTEKSFRRPAVRSHELSPEERSLIRVWS
jgi:PilZ domain-containing protein